MSECICGEINARHCPVHNEQDEKAREWTLGYKDPWLTTGIPQEPKTQLCHIEGPFVSNGDAVHVIEFAVYEKYKRELAIMDANFIKRTEERDRLREALERIAADTDWPGRLARKALESP